jgi:hypothetical protein
MKSKLWCFFAGLFLLVISPLCAVPSHAQMSEVKEKAPMYSYVANWQIPRANWADMDKAASANNAILEKAVADGTIVGYGDDVNLVHHPDLETHDNWWSSMSIAGLIKVLEQFRASDTSTSGVLASATKHWDNIYVSRYYNWKSGSWKGGYGLVAMYKLKADAPDNAVDLLSKNLVVPLLEKMLADGTILEYEIDTEAIHTSAPGTFAIVFIAPKPEGIDSVLGAIRGVQREHPLGVQAFGSLEDSSAHRDELMKGNGTYK